jgi:lipoate---protein ligase
LAEDEWQLEFERGPAEHLHRRSADLAGREPGRHLRVLEATRPALVLGSAQPFSDADAAVARRAGVEVARRRSGGGAVLVGPGQVLWVDLVIPAGDPLWDHDVIRAAWWVGDVWAAALDFAGLGPPAVWKSRMRSNRWSRRFCFAGVGPGEVLVGEHKVVGLSQRRTRHGALFQTAALLSWDPASIVGLLNLDTVEAAAATPALAAAARGLGPEHAGAILDGFQRSIAQYGPIVGPA